VNERSDQAQIRTELGPNDLRTHRPSSPKVHLCRISSPGTRILDMLRRRMKKRSFTIGQRIPGSKLVVNAFAESDAHGNQRIEVVCDCGNKKIMRATALTMKSTWDRNGKERKPHRSCGCESKRAYTNHLDDRATGIRKKVRRDVWLAHQKGKTFAQLAVQFPRLDVPVISAIVRLYNRKHGPSKTSAIPKGSRAKWLSPASLDWLPN
jgi:hypothetical protein